MNQTNEALALALVRTWVDAINRSDVEGELACWHAECEYTIVATGTTTRGIEALRRGGIASAAVIGDQPSSGRKQITNLFAAGDWACVEYDVTATLQGPIEIGGSTLIPAGTSRPLRTKVCIVLHIRDGKFDCAREYFDVYGMARQTGIDPAIVSAIYSSWAQTDPAG
ncbi:MAG TPA: nuclear transport factor 2 family protein [Terracidiphilus sp.]|nr:nuclear transport factor 2 family protein [Terracidiphilus sp.]